VVVGQLHAVGCQFGLQPASTLCCRQTAWRCPGQQQVADEDRVVIDIRAAQVQQPGNVVQCGNEVVVCAGCCMACRTAASLSWRLVLANGAG
jgi:hypothetical protein